MNIGRNDQQLPKFDYYSLPVTSIPLIPDIVL